MPEYDKLLNRLVLARKHIQFYPPNNPIVGKALNDLTEDLQTLFAPPADGSPALSTFQIEIGREGFSVDGEPVATDNDVLKRFANDLFKLGLKQLIFQAGVNTDEIQQFLTVLGRPADKIKEDGGIEEVIKEAALTTIHVSRPETLDMVTLDESAQQSLLKKGPAGYYLTPGNADASDLADFFDNLASDDPELREKLTGALANPDQLAQSFSGVQNNEPEGEGKGLSQDAMRKILKSISRNIASLPPDKRDVLVKNVADAVLASNSETPKAISHEELSQNLSESGFGDGVVSALSTEGTGTAFSGASSLHKGASDVIANYLEEFVDDAGAQTSLAEMAAGQLDARNAERLQDVAQLLKREKQQRPKEQPKPFRGDTEKRNKLSQERDNLIEELAVSEEDYKMLQQRMLEDCDETSYAFAGNIALALHEVEGMPLLTANLEGFLEHTLALLLHSEQYSDSSHLLAALFEECKNAEETEAQEERTALYERIKEKVCAQGKLNRFVAVFHEVDPKSEAYTDFLGCVHGLGEPAINRLLDEYSQEEDRDVRAKYIEFFREIGERCTAVLQKRVADAPPDRLRRMIGLVGALGSVGGFEIIEPLLTHNNPEVRKVTLNAMIKMKHERIEAAFIRAIADPDPAVGTHAVKIIERLRLQSALPALGRFLRSQHKDFSKEPDRCIAIAHTLGSLGGKSELAIFKEIMPGGLGGWLGARNQVTDTFRRAAEQIERRIEVKKAKRYEKDNAAGSS